MLLPWTVKHGSRKDRDFYSGKVSECTRCGKYETVCPQHLKIRDLLEEAAKNLKDKKKTILDIDFSIQLVYNIQNSMKLSTVTPKR